MFGRILALPHTRATQCHSRTLNTRQYKSLHSVWLTRLSTLQRQFLLSLRSIALARKDLLRVCIFHVDQEKNI